MKLLDRGDVHAVHQRESIQKRLSCLKEILAILHGDTRRRRGNHFKRVLMYPIDPQLVVKVWPCCEPSCSHETYHITLGYALSGMHAP